MPFFGSHDAHEHVTDTRKTWTCQVQWDLGNVLLRRYRERFEIRCRYSEIWDTLLGRYRLIWGKLLWRYRFIWDTLPGRYRLMWEGYSAGRGWFRIHATQPCAGWLGKSVVIPWHIPDRGGKQVGKSNDAPQRRLQQWGDKEAEEMKMQRRWRHRGWSASGKGLRLGRDLGRRRLEKQYQPSLTALGSLI